MPMRREFADVSHFDAASPELNTLLIDFIEFLRVSRTRELCYKSLQQREISACVREADAHRARPFAKTTT